MLGNESQKTKVNHLYRVKRIQYNGADEEFEHLIKIKVATLKRYKKKVKKYHPNRLFRFNQSHEENIILGKERNREFWSEIWDKDLRYNEEAGWIQKVVEEMQNSKHKNIEITPANSKK